MPQSLKEYQEEDVLYCSENGGFLYWLTDEQKLIVRDIEAQHSKKVWHVIREKYRMSGGDELEMETYLFISHFTEDPKPWNDGFLVYAFVRNITWGEEEYGDVVVCGSIGGLRRIWGYITMDEIHSGSHGSKVAGHIGPWYVTDVNTVDFGKPIFLLEHEEYGDEAAGIIVDSQGELLLDDVWNGFDDYAEAFGYDFY